mgnify:CR=1 FL=1
MNEPALSRSMPPLAHPTHAPPYASQSRRSPVSTSKAAAPRGARGAPPCEGAAPVTKPTPSSSASEARGRMGGGAGGCIGPRSASALGLGRGWRHARIGAGVRVERNALLRAAGAASVPRSTQRRRALASVRRASASRLLLPTTVHHAHPCIQCAPPQTSKRALSSPTSPSTLFDRGHAGRRPRRVRPKRHPPQRRRVPGFRVRAVA